tara:strand:- start:4643 stop:5047 length:405 start_codon:yes stop_codon:yes gene_type:complete
VLDNDRCRVELVAQLAVNTLLPCAVGITTILIGDVVEHAMKAPWWFSHHAINLFITKNKNHILRHMMPVRTHDVNSLSPQCKRAVTVACRYVTKIKEVSIVNQLTVTMKTSKGGVDFWNVNLPITAKYVTITLK